jgi:hypothetical protein
VISIKTNIKNKKKISQKVFFKLSVAKNSKIGQNLKKKSVLLIQKNQIKKAKINLIKLKKDYFCGIL